MTFFETFIALNETTTVIVDENFTASNTFQRLRLCVTIASSAALLLGLGCLSKVVLSFRYKHTRAQTYILKLLVGHIVGMSCSNFMLLFFSQIEFQKENWIWCSVLGGTPVCFYLMSHIFNYMLFLQRSKIIQLTKTKRLYQVFVLAKFGTVAAACIIAPSILFIRGRLLPNNVCVQFFPWKFAMSLAVLDSGLGVLFLLLFMLPMWQHLSNMRSMENNAKSQAHFVQMAKENYRWGTFAIISSFVLIVLSSSLQAANLIREDHGQPAHYHLFMIDYLAAPFDMCINLFSSMIITRRAWNPPVRGKEADASTRLYSTK